MLIDTHCHINMMVKKQFDTLLQKDDFHAARNIIEESIVNYVKKIINVGTSLIESKNCIELAKQFKEIYAAIGIHPCDLNANWMNELKTMQQWLKNKNENKIIAIGECGIDLYHKKTDLKTQKDAFKAQIEIALQNDLALIVHSRNAPDETLSSIEEFKKDIKKGVIHCFSENLEFAQQVIEWNFVIGLGGIITYPKNNELRDVAKQVDLNNIVLETDAPFLPPQIIRGKQNHPKYIKYIAQYLAEIRNDCFENIAKQTTENVKRVFGI